MSDGKIVIELNMDDTDFNNDILKAEGKTASFGSQLKNLLATFGLLKVGAEVFNLIRDSVGSAMDRLDTMDQFERVITTMTGSSKQAEQALNDIKEAVTGTAYGLDVAAKATQRFVTSGLDINKATEQTRIWGDAVAFYGDGSNDTYNGVTEALSRMVAKGKVEMDQMNRLTDAGIPALQIYADKVGRSTAEVQEDLSSGKISATEFVDTLTSAFTDGTAKFASISGAAKEAGASWKGTFDNMKAAVTRGVENLITSLDEGLVKAGLGSIKDNIANFGKMMENGLKSVASAIPPIIKLLKDLKPIILSLGTAWIAAKLVGGLADGVTMVKGLYGGFKDVFSIVKGDMGLGQLSTAFKKVSDEGGAASGVMGKLGEAFGAVDPVKLGLTVGVGLLVGGITLLKEVTDPTTESQKKLRSSLDELGDSMAEVKERTTKNMEEAISMDHHYGDLRNRLSEIVDENGKVKEGYEGTAQVILNELNEAYGTNIEMVDGVIQKYGEQMQTLDQVMEKMRAKSIIEANEEGYKEAVSNLDTYKTNYEQAYKDMDSSYSGFLKNYLKLRGEGVSKEEAYQQAVLQGLDEGQQLGTRKFEETWELFSESERQYLASQKTIRQYTKAQEAYISGDMQKVEEIYRTHAYNVNNIQDQSLEDLQTNLELAQNKRDAAAAIQATSGSKEEKKRLQAEIDAYDKDILLLQQNIDDRQGIISGSETDMAKAWQTLVDTGVTTTLGGVESMDEAGQALVQALADGSESKQLDANSSVRRVTDGMILTVNGQDYKFDNEGKYLGTVLTDATASVDGKPAGKKLVTDYIAGVTPHLNNVYEKGKELGSTAKKGTSDNNDGYQLGSDYGRGYFNGIASWVGSVFEQAKGLALTAKSGTKAGQQSSSPSKVARSLGGDYGEGYALGITDMIANVVASAKKLVNAAVEETTSEDFLLSGMKIGDELTQGIEVGLKFDESKFDGIKSKLEKFTKDVALNTKLDTVMNALAPINNYTNYNVEMHTTIKDENSQYELMQQEENLLKRMGWVNK